jgi:hypothetical protein
MRRTHAIVALTLLSVTACAKQHPQPEPKPDPIAAAQPALQQSQPEAQAAVDPALPEFLQPSDADYVGLVLAATGWARRTTRSLGIYQMTDGHWLWKEATEVAARKYGLRPIQQNDFTVVCGASPRPATPATQAKQVCSMKYVDAVMYFTELRMTRDSGYVGLGITRVPEGATQPRATLQCVTMTRKDSTWEIRKTYTMQDIHQCPRR